LYEKQLVKKKGKTRGEIYSNWKLKNECYINKQCWIVITTGGGADWRIRRSKNGNPKKIKKGGKGGTKKYGKKHRAKDPDDLKNLKEKNLIHLSHKGTWEGDNKRKKMGRKKRGKQKMYSRDKGTRRSS